MDGETCGLGLVTWTPHQANLISTKHTATLSFPGLLFKILSFSSPHLNPTANSSLGYSVTSQRQKFNKF